MFLLVSTSHSDMLLLDSTAISHDKCPPLASVHKADNGERYTLDAVICEARLQDLVRDPYLIQRKMKVVVRDA